MHTWQEKQGAILTANNAILRFSSVYRDFTVVDLPHYWLRRKATRKIFNSWLKANRRADLIVGCWSRPIFHGGVMESSESDTSAFNLQSPSFFIDMRFSHSRPELEGKNSFEAFTLEELFILSQQHCFAGYTLPELQACAHAMRVFTRHHMIDWNFHPMFPRNRPNRWFVQYYPDPLGDGIDSFKEFSTVRDADGVPIYFERWQRLPPAYNQQTKYLVLRKALPCPKKLASLNRVPEEHEERDALLIVIGDHFAFVQDRSYQKLSKFLEENGKDLLERGKGGGGAFIKYLLSCAQTSGISKSRADNLRDIMIGYLDLEGNYGQIVHHQEMCAWQVSHSTFPWNIGTPLFHSSDFLTPHFESDKFVSLEWSFTPSKERQVSATRSRRARGSWEVMECSLSLPEVYQLFGTQCKYPNSKL